MLVRDWRTIQITDVIPSELYRSSSSFAIWALLRLPPILVKLGRATDEPVAGGSDRGRRCCLSAPAFPGSFRAAAVRFRQISREVVESQVGGRGHRIRVF